MEWTAIEWECAMATNPLTCVGNLISTVMCSFSVNYSKIQYESCSNTRCRCVRQRIIDVSLFLDDQWIRSTLKCGCMRCDGKRDGRVGSSYSLRNKIDNFASSWRLITWEFTEIDLVLLTPCACAYASLWHHLFFVRKNVSYVLFFVFCALHTHVDSLHFLSSSFFCRQTSNSTYLVSVLPEITQKHTRMNNEFVDRREFFSCYRQTFCGNLHTIVTLCKYTHTHRDLHTLKKRNKQPACFFSIGFSLFSCDRLSSYFYGHIEMPQLVFPRNSFEQENVHHANDRFSSVNFDRLWWPYKSHSEIT